MKKLVIFSAALITGCATGLNSMQNQELMGYQAKGLAIEEKSTGTATALAEKSWKRSLSGVKIS